LVEQGIENPCVAGSIPARGTTGDAVTAPLLIPSSGEGGALAIVLSLQHSIIPAFQHSIFVLPIMGAS